MDYAKANRDGDKVWQRASKPAEPLLMPRPDLLEQAVRTFQRSLHPTRTRKKK